MMRLWINGGVSSFIEGRMCHGPADLRGPAVMVYDVMGGDRG
jgi:hypothetical protein